jgi:hypothetical protein
MSPGTPDALVWVRTEAQVTEQEVPMSTMQLPHRPTRPQKRRKSSARPAASAERVKEMLREIAFVLHATRVVRRMDLGVATTQGEGTGPLP